MNSNRNTAIIVGVLYIVATVAGVLTVAPLGSLLDGPDILTNFAANENKVIIVAFLELIMAVAVAGVAFMIYPILNRTQTQKSKKV